MLILQILQSQALIVEKLTVEGRFHTEAFKVEKFPVVALIVAGLKLEAFKVEKFPVVPFTVVAVIVPVLMLFGLKVDTDNVLKFPLLT